MIVLDASALLDVVIDQPSAAWVLDEIDGHEVSAPAHQPAEVLSAIARLRRARVLTRADAEAAVDEAMALEQDLVSPTAEHARRVLQLSQRVRVLDGLYVALAEERRCALVTSDRRLARATLPCEVRVPPG